MAGRDGSGSEKKSSDAMDLPIFNAENLQSNMRVIYYRFKHAEWSTFLTVILASYPLVNYMLCRFIPPRNRTFMSIIGGVTAGILGFTGLTGFIFYLLIMAITSVGLIIKSGFSVHSYFDSWNQIVLDGFLGGLMSFVLFWTFAYDIVHIF